MKSRFLVAIALVIGAIGCSVQETEVPSLEGPVQLVFKAEPFYDGDSSSNTKTSVIPNANYTNYSFIWSAKDTVGIYPNTGGQVYFEMSNGAGASSAQFDGGGWACKPNAVYRSYFPFIGDIYLDQTKIPVSFKGQKQVGNDNSDHFKKYDYMYTPATSSNGNEIGFSYKHLICGILVWAELPAGHYTSVTLTANEPVFVTSGEYDLTAANPAIVAKNTSVRIRLDLDITLDKTDILKAYIINAPIDLSGKTVTIAIMDDTGFMYSYSYTPGKAFAAANIYRMRAPGSLVGYEGESIVFADSNLKATLVAAFDTDDDGELSYKEASVVHSIKGVLSSDESYTSFEEFQYFTGINSIENEQFKGWGQLTSIVIPETVSSIGHSAFYNCGKLTSIRIPEGVKSLNYATFYGCTNLERVSLPSSLLSIAANVFYQCSHLASITIPPTVTSLGASSFEDCISLSSITIPPYLTTIENYTFRSTSITSLVIPDGVTTISQGAFYHCSELVTLTLPNSLSSIGKSAFNGCSSLNSITIPKNVQRIDRGAFEYCRFTYMVFEPLSPPVISSGVLANWDIYVPAESLDAYKNADIWNYYAERIYSLPYAVDLGLSVKWASWNVGANAPEEYGDYYAWGEVEPYYSSQDPLTWKGGKIGYAWASYKWCNGSGTSFTKYNTDGPYGDVDNKTVLDPEDDVAHVKLGGNWRMPTDAECDELINNCTWTWTTQNGVYGVLVTSKTNGNSIFLPAAGSRYDTYLSGVGSYGFYWSSSLDTDYPDGAWDLYCDSGNFLRGSDYRSDGRSVRPVSE